MIRPSSIVRWAERAQPGEALVIEASEPGRPGETLGAHWMACALVHGGWAIHQCILDGDEAGAVLYRTRRAWDPAAFALSLSVVNGSMFRRGDAAVCPVCGGPLQVRALSGGSTTCSPECAEVYRTVRWGPRSRKAAEGAA